MFKTIMLFVCLSALTVAAAAQKLKESQVPAATKSAFSKANPNTVGAWEKEDGNFEVVYKMDGKTMSSVIDKKGVILETETDLSTNDLPQNIQSYISQHYKNAKTKGAAKVVKPNGEVSYEVNVNGKGLDFDGSGKMLKKNKKEKEDEG